MRAVVTGAAGFIGSHLVERLLSEGWTVRGIDAFRTYYPTPVKELNVARALANASYSLTVADLAVEDLEPLLDGADVVFHAAAQPGVRGSWEDGFGEYVDDNVLATQRLLEASRQVGLRRFVFSSSSSVCGNGANIPSRETDPTKPYSPYGVTKLAGEHLCSAYAANWRVPTVSLRYFTVYGPRQRPDMAIHRLIECGLSGSTFTMFGTGEQRRDFTYVDDVVAANLAAVSATLEHGTVINIGGGETVSMNDLVEELGDIMERPIDVEMRDSQPGDVRNTSASIDRAREALGWTPRIGRREGLELQVAWHREAAVRGRTRSNIRIPRTPSIKRSA